MLLLAIRFDIHIKSRDWRNLNVVNITHKDIYKYTYIILYIYIYNTDLHMDQVDPWVGFGPVGFNQVGSQCLQ